MARVVLDHVSKTFDGDVTAICDLSLDIGDGEFLVIVGPSGCGKTTTLRIVAGLERPSAGSVYIGELRVNDVPPSARNVAMVFQDHALYPHMSVYRNIAFALKVRKVPALEVDRRVREVSGVLGIEGLLHRKPGTLSGGQCQRVALARAIVRDPNVFLFDEPLSNLDPALRTAMRTELKTLRTRLRAASVYVTHDQAEAMSLGERICVLCQGRVQQVGAALEIYERPVNKFVAGFFGTPPMSFFPGRLHFAEGGASILIGPDTVALPARLAPLLSQYRDKDVILGIRPEDLSLTQYAGRPGRSIQATVVAVEPVGCRTDVHLTAAEGSRFTAALDPHVQVRPSDNLTIYLDTEKAHVFEAGPAGRNLSLP